MLFLTFIKKHCSEQRASLKVIGDPESTNQKHIIKFLLSFRAHQRLSN